MLTKAGSETYENVGRPALRPRLSLMERCLLKWAAIDRDDRVLDVGLGNGLVAEYLLRNMECEVCGVSEDMELVRQTRSLARGADLVYATTGDIPWRDQAFHTVLMRPVRLDEERLEIQLREVLRVMKDGGQLVMGVENYPALARLALRSLEDPAEELPDRLGRRRTEALLRKLGFEQLSWQSCTPFSGALIGWKHNALTEKLCQEETRLVPDA